MTEVGELRVRIENAASNIMEDYDRTLKTVGKLKEKMNELEQRMSQKRPEEVEEDMYHLRLATERLNRLTDSQILRSKKAWKEYEELEHDCKMQTLQLPELDGLRAQCKKTEQFAADLLCYSMGLSKRKTFEQPTSI